MPQRYLPPAESRFLGKLRNSVSSRRAPREQQAHKDQVQPTCPRRRTQIYEESGLNDRAPIKQGRSRALGLHPVPRPNDPLEPSTIVLLEQFFGFAQRALLVDAWVRHPLKSIRLDKVHAIFRTVSPRTQLNREQKRGTLLDHTRPPSRAASTTRRMEST